VRRRFLLFFASVAALAQQRNFVACPIVRDTSTVPCFLAEYEGETYFLGIQQDITADFHPPQLKHEVLVEGQVVPGPRVCGGIPLKPLAISVLKEVNLACNTLLPAEPGIDAPAALRGPGPSSRHPESAAATREPLSGAQEFTVLYAFDDDYLDFAGNRVVTEAADYAKRIGALSVKVAGYRATTVLSNGTTLIEKPGLAQKRAQNITTVLRGLGVANVAVDANSEPESRRRVTILVSP